MPRCDLKFSLFVYDVIYPTRNCNLLPFLQPDVCRVQEVRIIHFKSLLSSQAFPFFLLERVLSLLERVTSFYDIVISFKMLIN